MKFVVKRDKWMRGLGEGTLYDRVGGKFSVWDDESDDIVKSKPGSMCCLGFVCQQLGVDLEDMEDVSMPSRFDLYRQTKFRIKIPRWLEKLEDAAANINDAEDLTDQKREHELKELFNSYGHEIVFED